MKRSLTLQFARPADFLREYERNLSVGGAVVACDISCELREVVDVEVICAFCNAGETVEAEVVFCDPVAGTVAVQFLQPAAEVRAVLAPIEARAREADKSPPQPVAPPTPESSFADLGSPDGSADFGDLGSSADFGDQAIEIGSADEDLDLGLSELDGIEIDSGIGAEQVEIDGGIGVEQDGGIDLDAFEINSDPQASALPEVEAARAALAPIDSAPAVEAVGDASEEIPGLERTQLVSDEAPEAPPQFEPIPTQEVEAVLAEPEPPEAQVQPVAETDVTDLSDFSVDMEDIGDIDVEEMDIDVADIDIEGISVDVGEAESVEVPSPAAHATPVPTSFEANSASATGMSLEEPLPTPEPAATPVPVSTPEPAATPVPVSTPEPAATQAPAPIQAESTEPPLSVSKRAPGESGRDGIPNAVESIASAADASDLESVAYETGEFEIQYDQEDGSTEELPQVTTSEEKPGDRRTGERGAARVPVRVDSNHISFEGRTRDLSDNGVLISVDGTELPVGRQVQLSLTHPETREELNVSGVVARHVQGSGTVAAVGVAVDGTEQDKQRFEAFVRDVQQLDSQRRASGINGAIEELGIANLLQMLCQSSDRGTLTLRSGQEEGVIAFESGYLRYSRLGTLRSNKAFARMIEWSEGEFDFIGQVDALSEEDEPIAVEAALMDAMRLRDEAARRASTTLDPGTQLAVDMAVLAQEGSNLDKTQEAVIDLAAAGFTVRKVLDIIPEADAAVIEAIEELRILGIVQVQDE